VGTSAGFRQKISEDTQERIRDGTQTLGSYGGGMNKHLDSNFDDFLAEDDVLAETEAVVLKRLLDESREQIARGESLTAEEVFLESNQIDPLTEAINQVADQVDTRLESGLKRLQNATLKRR
jgi:hypothetical protein